MSRNLQEHILQAASGLFYRQGIKSTGVDAIVKAAGTTKMSLYKYFPSKDDLVLAHLRRSRATTLAHLQSAIAGGEQTPRQKLLAIFDVFDAMLDTPAFRGCPFINAAAEFAEENNPVQQAAAEFYAEFGKLLADLAEQAGSRDPKSLAAQLTLLIAGAIVGEQIHRNSAAIANARAAATLLIDYNLAQS